MMNFLKSFRNEESGAVTVDWVVLTAAVVGLAIAAYGAISTQTELLATSVSDAIADEDTFTTEETPETE